MNKTIKIISILMIIVMLCMITVPVFADEETTTEDDTSSVLSSLKDDIKTASVTNSTKDFSKMAGKIIRLIRNAAVILAVILITVLGIKYMMGSAEEKSGYQKSFIPLIVGIVVVVAATQIATMLFGIAGN